MKRLILFTLIVFMTILMSTCSKNTNNNTLTDTIPKCDSVTLVNSPLDVTWVQKVIAGRDCQYILLGSQMSTGIYNNRIVVYFENPASNLGTCVGKVYNCNGTILLNWMENGWLDFEQNYTNKKVFWVKPK